MQNILLVVVLIGVAFAGGWFFSKDAEEISETAVVEEQAEEIVVVESKQTLDLSSQGLLQVPESVFRSTNTKILNLSNNYLSGAVQGEIRFLTKLEALDLSHNNLTGVPAEVGQLRELRVLNLSHNSITGLPHEIGNLQKLEVLDLRNTQYSQHDFNVIKEKLPTSTRILVD